MYNTNGSVTKSGALVRFMGGSSATAVRVDSDLASTAAAIWIQTVTTSPNDGKE